MTLTFGSLFAGIGGLDLGLERAGMKCMWQVEVDSYARQILARHWPDVPKYRDIRFFLGGKRWRRRRAAWAVDLICGGFPCQDISLAGRGEGIGGKRSGLWSEFARIVRLLRPRYVLVENVPALLGRGMGRVLGDLAACGYDCQWDCIPAATLGAPHIRDRLFVVAYPAGERGDQEKHGFALPSRRDGRALLSQRPPQATAADADRQRRQELDAAALAARAEQSGRGHDAAVCDAQGVAPWYDSGQRWPSIFGERRCFPWGEWSPEPGVGRVADGVPCRVDRLRGLGNAVVPQVAEWIGRRVLDFHKSTSRAGGGSGEAAA